MKHTHTWGQLAYDISEGSLKWTFGQENEWLKERNDRKIKFGNMCLLT